MTSLRPLLSVALLVALIGVPLVTIPASGSQQSMLEAKQLCLVLAAALSLVVLPLLIVPGRRPSSVIVFGLLLAA